ncbi:MAG: DNA-binding protein [Hyphomonadaceae bacterium]|nr:MAG: DNA-binding protein [Hyphomonadaceae bacterium]KAF0183283.1 MAG: DNA-binding protein [Hyphomonadaceae bacterium]
MQAKQNARRQLDKRLGQLPSLSHFARPPKGWIKAIREALGMTMAQLANRLGVSQPRISVLERAEASGSITMETLERAANALDCNLAYILIPRRGGLNDLVEQQAIKAALQKIKSTKHSMALEKQSVDQDDEQEQLIRTAKSLAEKSDSSIWDTP